MKKKRIIVLAVVMILATAIGLSTLVGCNKNKGKNVIVATVYPVAQLTKKIVGDKYQVHQLIKGEVHGHEYTVEDNKEIEKAAKVFYISDELEGHEVEHWKNGVAVIDEQELIKGEGHEHHEHGEEHHHHEEGEMHQAQSMHAGHHHDKDPHVWTSPKRALKMLENIKNEVVKMDSKNKDYYEKNYQNAKKELDELDKAYADFAKNTTDKAFHVTHGAFGYIAHDYGLVQEALSKHEIEVSAKEKTEFINDLVEDKAKILYYVDDENSEDYKSAKSIQEEVKKQGHNIEIKRLNRIIFANNEKDDYFKILKDNLTVLKANM